MHEKNDSEIIQQREKKVKLLSTRKYGKSSVMNFVSYIAQLPTMVGVCISLLSALVVIEGAVL